jgi:aryl-alcohol dehydrogenase-like predicted oxidoreductase
MTPLGFSVERRKLGTTGIRVSPVALGAWPIAGMTSVDVNDRDSLATIEACFEVGVNFIDTAYCYGATGESERLIARAISGRRDQVVLATKGGIEWAFDVSGNRQQVVDGRPATLRRHCEESLRRLDTDRVELLYLHAPDPKTPLAESAGELKRLLDEGKTRAVGVSNVGVDQLDAFHRVCPLSAFQPPYNMLQREIEAASLPWCREHRISVMVYWPLMKGLLAGKMRRDHVFDSKDGRAKYPMFQGDEWQKNQDFVDVLRGIAEAMGRTVADVVVNWTIHRPGIAAALCGAKRPEQLRETAAAMSWQLSAEQLATIDVAIAARGKPVTRRAVQ